VEDAEVGQSVEHDFSSGLETHADARE
jgi:hypothetical protein